MGASIREKTTHKKDNNKGGGKFKRSYHAYLEHPRLKHQPVVQSPKGKSSKESGINQSNLASRPKHK